MSLAAADRLLGLLAIQVGLVTPERLDEALSAVRSGAFGSLEQALAGSGALDARSVELLRRLAQTRLADFSGDVDEAVRSLRRSAESLNLAAQRLDGSPSDELEGPGATRAFAEPALRHGTERDGPEPTVDSRGDATADLGSVLAGAGPADGAATGEFTPAPGDETGAATERFDAPAPAAGGGNETTDFTVQKNPTPRGPDRLRRSGPRFKIVREHARGGLGEVLIARDTELNRLVALKRIQAKFSHQTESRLRFLLEAEITGQLEHPGIVPIYSLGLADDGRPYYAMRFIEGESLEPAIARYHAGRPRSALELRRLLRVFLDVCNAVHFAHSRGFVHRDLKPENVMIGSYGETLVVDWGLAKRLAQGGPPATERGTAEAEPAVEDDDDTTGHLASVQTRMGSIAGTPQYMSPEQAAGRPDLIGTRSDVYSLGATLFTVLTGQRPFEAKDVRQILRQCRNGETRSPRSVLKEVPRPLDAVCRKAMANESESRYESAKALAEDLERWLADEPVRARRESWYERAWRLARKHRAWTQAVAAAVVLVAVVSIISAVAINAARLEARTNFLKARQTVDTYFTRVSETTLLDVPGLQPLRRELLEDALVYYQDFVKTQRYDPSLQLELAGAFQRIGQVQRDLARPAEAREAFAQARRIVEPLAATDVAASTLLADVINAQGAIEQAAGRRDAALGLFREALTRREALAESAGGMTATNLVAAGRKAASSRNNVAIVLAELGRFDEAIAEFNAANERRRALAQRAPEDLEAASDLAKGLYNLGVFLRDNRRLGDALGSFDEAIAVQRALVASAPRSIDHARELAVFLRVGGALRFELTQAPAAAEELAEARRRSIELARRNPFLVELQADAAAALAAQAEVQERTGASEVLETWRTAAEVLEGACDADPESARYRADLAEVRERFGRRLLASGEHVEARTVLEQVLAILDADEPGSRARRARVEALLVVACRAGDDPAAALEHAGEAVRAAEELDRLEPSPETVAMLVQALEERSRSQAAAGDAAKAVADLVRVTELLAPARDASPAGAVAWSRAQRELAIAAFEAGDDARAVAAIEAAEATLGPVAESDKSPETQAAWTDVLRVRTEIAVALDDVATAERVLERRRGLKSLSTDETADQALTWAELARREGDPDDVRARRAARAVELGRSAIEAGVSPEAEQADERWGWLRALVLTAAPSPAGSP